MKLHHVHRWDLSPDDAVRLQERLRAQVVVAPLQETPRHVAGVDVGFRNGRARAVVTVLTFPALQLAEHAVAEVPVTFPYIPGLLSFREVPAVLAAIEQLRTIPDLVLVDGQGIAHPRRFGIASHLGVLLDWPTVGCAKSVLVGRYDALAETPGSTAMLVDRGEVIGMAVRTRQGASPLIVSVGHRVDLPTAVAWVLACTRGYRLPEPTRLAHHLSSRKEDTPTQGTLF